MSEPGPSTSTAALAPSTSSTRRLSMMPKSDHPSSSPAKGGAGAGSDNAGGGAGVSTGSGSGSGSGAGAGAGAVGVKDLVTPGELCGFVDNLLAQLETRFDEMSEQVLGRMNEMSVRIDTLENTIQDLMHGGIEGPSTPTPASGQAVGGAGGKR